MNLIRYFLYVPFFVIIKELFLKKTHFIIYSVHYDIFETLSNNMIIFNICYLIYESIIHYISYLYDFYKIIIFYIFLVRNFINMFLYRKINNYDIIIRNMNLSVYFNSIILFLENYILFTNFEISDVDEDKNLKKGYINIMLLISYIYFIYFLYILINYRKKLKINYLNNIDILNNIHNEICCICLENIESCNYSKLSCCYNWIHSKCLCEYVDYYENKTCPLCRKNLEIINCIRL